MGISSGIGSTVGALPAGSVIPFAGSSAPANWLLCAGQAVSRTDYRALFAVIGTTYGSGDGSTTFNVPDLRGRVPAGLDNMNGTDAGRLDWANTLGTNGGTQTHTLSTTEMPAHTHSTEIRRDAVASSPDTIYQLQKIVTGAWNTLSYTSTSTGGGGAHNNMQPTILLNYIIKATAL